MTTETYFKNFNTIQYGNNSVVDITERVVVLNNVEKNPYVYYPLEITDGARSDQIADASYNDPYSSWVLYLSNDIVDPYYEWYLTQDQFNNFIITKYGSIENAMNKIAFWRNDWVDKDNISTLTYNAEIAGNPNRMKYWSANYNYSGNIISYSRTKTDWKVNTNKIYEYSIDTTGATLVKTVTLPDGTIQEEYFIANEIVTIGDGRAQVVQSNSTVVIVNNVIDVVENSTGVIVGQESGNMIDFNSIKINAVNVSYDEIVYWKSVSYYEVEDEKNQGNKTIRVMQPQYVPAFIKNTKALLSNT